MIVPAVQVSDTTTEGGSETKPEETSKEEASQATPGRPVPPARRASGSQHKSRRGGTRRSTPAKARPLPGSLKPDVVHDRGMKAPTDMIGRRVVLEVLSTNTLATIVWQVIFASSYWGFTVYETLLYTMNEAKVMTIVW